MNSTDLIQGAINGHAQSTAQLAGVLISHDFPIHAAYAEVHKVTTALLAAGKIHRHPYADCWQLPSVVKMEDEPDPQLNKLRPGTVVPKKFRHLV